MNHSSVTIPLRTVKLHGDLRAPERPRGLVLFAHGSGSSRHSPRNRYVARILEEAGLATLLIDLLTEQEEAVDARTRHLRFNIRLLAERLVDATDWVQDQPPTRRLAVGYFGASTGAAAALIAAAERPAVARAVVSRGGRPDLALDILPRVTQPTLLIVGGADVPVIELNRQALAAVHAEKRLEIVPGATHLFEEPGTLEAVAGLARDWFDRHLTATRTDPSATPPPPGRYRDRAHAGRVLATRLAEYAGRGNVLVLALPRGGVPVGFEVAKALAAPLDVFVVRKLGVPGHEEFAFGAIASGGVRVINQDVVNALGLPAGMMEVVAAREGEELARRERQYRETRPAPDVRDRVVILVDDGLATGATMRAAAVALRRHGAARIVVAVPVGATQACDAFRDQVDDVVCAVTPEPFHAVGLWYDDFSQTSDEEVRELLRRAEREIERAV